MDFDKQAWDRAWSGKDAEPYAPFAVTVSRRCYAAENGGCMCDGSCKEPISDEDRERAIRCELTQPRS